MTGDRRALWVLATLAALAAAVVMWTRIGSHVDACVDYTGDQPQDTCAKVER